MSGKFKYYAIIDNKDGTGAIVETWEECEKRVKNVSNINYKGFNEYAEAVSWIDGKPRNGIFVDGATDGNGKVVWSIVVIHNHTIERIECGLVSEQTPIHELGSVGGELFALLMALKYLEYYNLPIYVDYEGTKNFITGDYVAQKEGTKVFMEEYKRETKERKLMPRVEYIQAHSGITGNEVADAAAKLMLRR